MIQRSTVAPKDFWKIFFFLFGWMMNKAGCKALEHELSNLKRLLEGSDGQARRSAEPR
jgi:hypothetical protein